MWYQLYSGFYLIELLISTRKTNCEEDIEKLGYVWSCTKKAATSPESPKLPEFRVSRNHKLHNVSIDYARLLHLKENVNTCVTMSKCLVLLFMCAATQTVYLELTPDVGTHSLIFVLGSLFRATKRIPKLFLVTTLTVVTLMIFKFI